MVIVDSDGDEHAVIYDGSTDAISATAYSDMSAYRYLHNKRDGSGLMYMWLDDTAWGAAAFTVAGNNVGASYINPEGSAYALIAMAAGNTVTMDGPYKLHCLIVPTDGTPEHAAALYQELSAAEASKAIRTAYETAVIAEQNKRIIGS